MAIPAVVTITITAIVGIALVIVGGILIKVFHGMIDDQLKQDLPLKNGTDSYSNWLDPPVPIYMQFYLFDVLNRAEVILGEKPVLGQKGPYTYREYRKKEHIKFNQEQGTVEYEESKIYVFDRNMSVGSENDTVHTVNLFMVGIIQLTRYMPSLLKEAINGVFVGVPETLIAEYTVHETLWGHKDPIIKDIKKAASVFGITLDIEDTFGLFYGQNNSRDGVYNIYTGEKGLDKYVTIKTWNGSNLLNYWGDNYTNMINGTDGTQFPPGVTPDRTLQLFSTDICRSIYANYEGPQKMRGIDLYRFVPPTSVFAAPAKNPANLGFCADNETICLGSGVLNVSVCKPQNAPIVLSQPHFYQADKEYIDGVIGLNPNKEEHQTALDVEPVTGVVMGASKRIQISIFLQKEEVYSDFENLGRLFLPVVWINESAKVDDKSANLFKNKVMEPIKVTEAVQYGLIAVGSFILLCAIIFALKKIFAKKQNLFIPLDSPSDEARLVTN
ncbi:unnamed protein product [Owenia fusiformis]|uniref:Uncharacterized protein n=1 Tax=Owenia fusiformis TaxID=6347 RepID=A0A8J1THR8_OWEFU|nr:unnamed protein product [Owenia fusiformis]